MLVEWRAFEKNEELFKIFAISFFQVTPYSEFANSRIRKFGNSRIFQFENWKIIVNLNGNLKPFTMGAKKTHQFSDSELKTAKLANALAHPARIRILSILSEGHFIRNIDLVDELQLVRSSVNKHLKFLLDADLIDLEFLPNCYRIIPKFDTIDRIPDRFEMHFAKF